MKTHMSSDARNELEAKYDERVQKIREAATAAIRPIAFGRTDGASGVHAEVTRIAHEKLHPHGCDLVGHRTDDGVRRFLIRVQSTGREYDLIRSFVHQGNGR